MSDSSQMPPQPESVAGTIVKTAGGLLLMIFLGMVANGVFSGWSDPPIPIRGPDGRVYETSEELVRAMDETHPEIMQALRQTLFEAEASVNDLPADAERPENRSK